MSQFYNETSHIYNTPGLAYRRIRLSFRRPEMASTPDSATPLRSGRFTFQRPVLLWPRLHLYPDYLELSGWRWLERYRRSIPFAHILQVDTTNGTLVLWLMDGRALRLSVADATGWREAIDAHL
jgi:hypothetical protein